VTIWFSAIMSRNKCLHDPLGLINELTARQAYLRVQSHTAES